MTTPIKTIAIVHEFFPLGGAERRTYDMAAYLSGKGYKLYIFVANIMKQFLPADEKLPFTIIQLPEGHISRSLKDAEFIAEQIKEHRIDAVMVPVITMKHISLIIKETGCKYIHINHGSAFWEVPTSLLSIRKKFQRGVWNRINWYVYQYPVQFLLHRVEWRTKRKYMKTLALSDRYVVLCQEYKDEIRRKLNGTPLADKIEVIPNPQRRVEHVNMNKKKQLLFVGRLSYADKRVDRLVEIWSRIYKDFPDYEMILVGEGEERPKLEKMISEKNLPRIRLAGATRNVQPYYDTASVLLLTSSVESWGLCLTEAQANGVVPIAFECSAGVRTVLSPSGKNGILVPADDMDAYVRELRALLNNPQKLEQLRQNVLNKVKDFDYETIEEKWVSMIESL